MTRSYVIDTVAADRLGITTNQLEGLVDRGWITPVTNAKNALFRPEDVTFLRRTMEKHPEADWFSPIEKIDLDRISFSEEATKKIPLSIVENYQILPFNITNGQLLIAFGQKNTDTLSKDLTIILDMPVKLFRAESHKIKRKISRLYSAHEPKIMYPIRSTSGRLRISPASDIKGPVTLENALLRWRDEPTEFSPRVFVAMPFAPKFDSAYTVIEEAVREVGGRSLRIDQVANLRNIWMAIEKEISIADVLVADFTGDIITNVPNPNVVTEATIAFYKYEIPVVTLTQDVNALFFDWRHHFAIVYSDDQLESMKKRLKNKLQAEFAELTREKTNEPERAS